MGKRASTEMNSAIHTGKRFRNRQVSCANTVSWFELFQSAHAVERLRDRLASMVDEQRRSEVIALWLARSVSQRTASDVIAFHRWMGQHHPDLLSPSTGGTAARLLFAVLGRHVR